MVTQCGWILAQVMACCLTAPSHYLTNTDFSFMSLCGIHFSAILQWMPPPPPPPPPIVCIMNLKISAFKIAATSFDSPTGQWGVSRVHCTTVVTHSYHPPASVLVLPAISGSISSHSLCVCDHCSVSFSLTAEENKRGNMLHNRIYVRKWFHAAIARASDFL